MAVYFADEQSDVEVDLDRLRRLAELVLTDRRVPVAMECSVLCVDAQVMTGLNEQHMDAQGPTDVLAFPMDMPGETTGGGPAILGDVVLCPSVAAASAGARYCPVTDELELLVVHGILHLLGHDHAEPRERTAMFGLTDELLTRFRSDVGTARAGEPGDVAAKATP